MTSISSHQDVVLFHAYQDDSPSCNSYQSSQQHRYHNSHLQYGPGQTSDLEVNSSGENTSRKMNVDIQEVEIQTPRPDYDNVISTSGISSQAVKEGGADQIVLSNNAHRSDSTTCDPLDASNVGGVGTTEGGLSDSESVGHHFSGGYKGGCDDSTSRGSSCRNPVGDRETRSAGVEKTCAADVTENKMGNDLFSARTASVSDARADGRASRNKNGVKDKVKPGQGVCTKAATYTRVTYTSGDVLLHTEPIDTSHPPASAVCTQPESRNCKEQDNSAIVVDEITSHPSLNNLEKFPSRDVSKVLFQDDSEINFANENVNTMIKISPAKVQTTDNKDSSGLPQFSQVISRSTPETNLISRSSVHQGNGHTSENTHVTMAADSYHVPVNGSIQSVAAKHIPSNNVISTDVPVIIITPSIPENHFSSSTANITSPTSSVVATGSGKEAGSVVESSSFQITSDHDLSGKDETKQNAQTEVSTADTVKGTKTMPKSAPVGGVKVLPSKFTFNIHSFRETKKILTPASSVSSTNNTTELTTSDMLIREESKSATYSVQPSGNKKDNEHITGITDITNIQNDITNGTCSSPTTYATVGIAADAATLTSTVTTRTTNTAKESQAFSMKDSEIEHVDPSQMLEVRIENDSCHEYAVPSDLSLESPSNKTCSVTQDKTQKAKEGSTLEMSGKARHAKERVNSTHYKIQKGNADIEDIYAVPIPKSQRQAASVGLDNVQRRVTEDHVSQTVSSLELTSSPESATKPGFTDFDNDDAFDDVVMRKPPDAASHMKKSTTTDMIHSYSSDYSSIPKANGRNYDYFSLGRRPKRPRIKTLTDSQGMAVSLDMLLKLRRQSNGDVPSTTAAEQTLSIDDILRSCLEFEEDLAFYRSRTNSDSVKKISVHPLSFNEINNLRLPNSDTAEKTKSPKTSKQGTTCRPILKKGQNDDSGLATNTKAPDSKQGFVTSGGIIKHDRATERQNGSLERKKLSHSAVVKSKGIKSCGVLTDPQIQESGKKVASESDCKTTFRKPDNVTSYYGPDYELRKYYYMTDYNAVNITDSADKAKSGDWSAGKATSGDNSAQKAKPGNNSAQKAKSGDDSTEKANSGEYSAAKGKSGDVLTKKAISGDVQYVAKETSNYDSVTENNVSQHSPSRVTFSTATSNQNRSHSQENERDTKDTKTKESASPVLATSQIVDSQTSAQKLPEVPMPLTNVSISEQAQHSTLSTVRALNKSDDSSRPVVPGSIIQPPSSSWDFRDQNDTPNHRTTALPEGVSSPPAAVSSSGLSSLSVDVTHSGNPPSPRQRSPNYNAKLEAAEAVKWLRAAGFPQYAQMFEDGQFPVDMGVVEKDHDFLDKDSLQSLFRRLETLNRYAGIKLDAHPCKKAASEDDDEDDICALSECWEYQKSARRWSRKDLSPTSRKPTAATDLAGRSGSHDSLLADQDSGSQTGESPLLESKMPHHQGRNDTVSLSRGGHAVAEVTPLSFGHTDSPVSPRLRRATSEKMKTAKTLFKKMEGFKSSKSRRHGSHRNAVEISGPVLADRENMQARLDRLNCVDISPSKETIPSPSLGSGNSSVHTDVGIISPHSSSPTSPSPTTSPRPRSDFVLRPTEIHYSSASHSTSLTQPRSSHTSPTQPHPLAHDSSFDEYYNAQATFLHNLQSPQGTELKKISSDTNLMEIFLVPQDHQPGRFPRILQNGYIETEACGTAVNVRTGSVRLGRSTGLTSEQNKAALSPHSRAFGQRISVYDNFLLPADSKKSTCDEISKAVESVVEGESSSDSKETVRSVSRNSAEISTRGSSRETSCDSDYRHDTSRGSSVARTVETASDQERQSANHETNVGSRSSSSSSRTQHESVPASDAGATSTDSRSTTISPSDSFSSNSRGVTHSSSVDSYFNAGSSEVPVEESSEGAAASTFQQQSDEFDRILQELYQNINDLTSLMDKDKPDKISRLVRASTSPLPAGNKKPHPLHVATPTARPVLKTQQAVCDPNSPVSTTSDLVPSPASPRSGESLDYYRDLDNENSSSGGEGSNTAESGSEDQEVALTDVSHDDSLDQIIEVPRERRDSGVGHSLTRAPSDRRRKKIRWHSFQKSHRPDVSCRAMQINSLTVGQLVRLQKLSLLKLTGIMEKCLPVNKSGWNWMVPRFMKRHKAPDFSDKNVFGVPLSVMAQRTGQPLPQCVLYAMRYLRRTCQSAVGIFRKSGVRSKIQQLRDYLESHPDTTNFDGENAYNVADMLKTFFRDLPECLLTNKMSETFRSIYTYVPPAQRLEAIQAAMLLLPDENREVLQSILLFLSDISAHEADHQMNASNLAVCFTPTVFHLGPRQSVPYSPKRNRKNSGVPDPREILEQKAAHECLLMMITECKKLFTVSPNLFRQLQVQSIAHMEPTLPQDIGRSSEEVRAFGQERIQLVLKEAHDKNRGWVPTMTVGDVEVFHRKPVDDCPLKEWKLVVDIEAPPIEVLRRIMHERHTWDEDLLSWSVVDRLDNFSDIFQYVLNSMAPHPPRNFCVLRYWRSDLNKGACALITMSVEHSDSQEVNGVWAIDLGTYYLMEPCGSGRSRLTYVTRVDMMGRMPEWYTKIFGHLCANFLERLKESFKQDTTGPETKV